MQASGTTIRLGHIVLSQGIESEYIIHGVSLWQYFFETEGVVVKKLIDVSYVVSSKSWKADKIIHTDKMKKMVSLAQLKSRA